MRIRMNRLHGLLILMGTLLLGGTLATTLSSQGGPTQSFAEAELFFELNDTDGDLGIHASIDGGSWTNLVITDPNGRTLLTIASQESLSAQGLTQLSIESAEPPFEELAPPDFFLRFPLGEYVIEAQAQGGGALRSTATISHVLAAPPENILVSGLPAAESCDAKPLPRVSPPVVIDWAPVTTSHPDIGESGPITVSLYQLFVEREGIKFSVDLPRTVTEFEVPTWVTAQGNQFKFEIIVRTATGNNTAVESCFRMR